jgi:hypothetical protein
MLLGSGVMSALALTIITSNRWHLLDPEVGVKLVLFLQWQVLGLTLTKLGVDQIIFAAVTENPHRRASTRIHMQRRAFPLGAVFGILVTVVFGPWVSAGCVTSLLFDTQSTFLAAELNARERYSEVTIASLLNYPLFFSIIFALQVWHPLGFAPVLAIFVLTSVVRWVWLSRRASDLRRLPAFSCQGTTLTGVAPLLNFLMFRVDQVLLGTTLISALVSSVGGDFLRQLLFAGRYQELASGGLTLLTGILLPRLHIPYPVARTELLKAASRGRWLVVAYGVAMIAPLAGYSLLWRGPRLSLVLLGCTAASAFLILPANALTYSMIRQGHLRGLIRNLAVAVITGIVIISAGYAWVAPRAIMFVVPVQLGVFVVLAFTRSWLMRERLYDSQ